jgi:hypothetical protein
MANTTTATCLPLFPSLEMAWRDVDSSFERFCLTAGIGAVEQMLREDAQQLTGAPHRRGGGRVGHQGVIGPVDAWLSSSRARGCQSSAQQGARNR